MWKIICSKSVCSTVVNAKKKYYQKHKKYFAIFGFLVDIFAFLRYNYIDIVKIEGKEREHIA